MNLFLLFTACIAVTAATSKDTYYTVVLPEEEQYWSRIAISEDVTDIIKQPSVHNERYITDDQLEMTMNAVARVIAMEIGNVYNRNLNSTWDYLTKFNFNSELLVEKVVKFILNNEGCARMSLLLNFINSTSNEDFRFSGYRAIFQKKCLPIQH